MVLFSMLLGSAMVVAAAESPDIRHGLHYTEPATTWDEAFPLGNGTLGALVWGDGSPLNISLDRTDLWDLRPVPEYHSENYSYALMRRWEKEGRYEELKALYDDPYHRPAPTKIPAGRIVVGLPPEAAFLEGRLHIGDGIAEVRFRGDVVLRAWIHAEQPVGFIEIENVSRPLLSLKAPDFAGEEDDTPADGFVMGELAQLGYPAPGESSGDGFYSFEQEGWGGFSFAVHLRYRPAGAGTIAAWSVASSFEAGGNPASLARERAEAALESLADLRASHGHWWSAYWKKGWIRVPNAAVERQWYLDMYKFGAAARRNAPPITLQGPWTADDGKLPPWKGDYHHDLNTQLSYWPAYGGNRLEEGLGFLDWLWKHRGNAENWTRRFFDMPGLNVPMTSDLELKQMGGWRQYTHSSTTAAWLAHHFYLHWIYSRDRSFLTERAYPWIEATAVFLEAVTNERDENGGRTLPLSSSPEIHDNKPEAWFPTITNYDNALIRWTFEKAAELAEELGKPEEAKRWRRNLGEMPPLALDASGALLVAAGHPLEGSHRHFSHLMAFHPLGSIDRSQGAEAERTIRATLDDLTRLGTDWWTGYSFAWLASLAARAGEGAAAERALEIFAEAFVLRNSFHCNGDQSGKGYSRFRYRPFTLEGNFAAAAGLNEMLLQSHTGVVEVFPAVPDTWRNASFSNLRAVGAFLVSATREDGRTTRVVIESETGDVPVVKCPWTAAAGRLDSEEIRRVMSVRRDGNRWILTSETGRENGAPRTAEPDSGIARVRP
jgi:alpha-L-fucosidase 2